MTLSAYDPRTLDVLSTIYTTTLLDVTAGRRLSIDEGKVSMKGCVRFSAKQDYLRAPYVIVNAISANLALYQVLLASSLETGELDITNAYLELGRLVVAESSIACRQPISSDSPCPYELVVERERDEKGREVFSGEFQLSEKAFLMHFRGVLLKRNVHVTPVDRVVESEILAT